MTDALALSISTMVVAGIGMITTIATLLINNRNARKIAAELKETNAKVEQTNTKVDEYHKETNSKLSQLVVAEKGVSFAEGERQGKADQIIQHDKESQGNTGDPASKGDVKVAKEKLDEAKTKIEEAKKKIK